jgi:hypothetical protein
MTQFGTVIHTSPRYLPRILQAGMAPIPRCCASHPDWPTLAQHLLNDFPAATISEVIREMRNARGQAERAGLTEPDGLLVAELITRHRLLGRAKASVYPPG